MCHVYDNPKHLLGHVDSLMKEVEKSADDDEIRRIIESMTMYRNTNKNTLKKEKIQDLIEAEDKFMEKTHGHS